MTVNTTTNVITYAGNGATVTFSFSFPAVAASDLVVMTTTAGVTTIQPTANYTVTLNSAVGTNPTPAGGSITMNSAPALGTSLTIERLLPVTQNYSFANQGTLYQSTIEQSLDYVVMLVQQFGEQVTNAIQGPATDPAGLNYILPAVAQRALGYVSFDSSGNVIITNGTSSTNPVSSAMTPVVSAASLAIGRTAFGLGNVAVENIGQGLADSSGSLQVVFLPSADVTNQSVTSSFHQTQRFATGALTYTLPRANTLFSGFGFTVTAQTGLVTFAINAADKFSGGSTGVSMIIPPGTYAYITTDGATNGIWYIQLTSLPDGTVLNGQLTATVATNQLTINLVDRNGNTPSTASPVFVPFRNPTLTGGDIQYLVVTSALSIVVPNTATLGTVSNQANRLWVSVFNNAGTPVLGVYNSLNSTVPTVVCWDETNVATGTAVAAASNSAQTWYTNGAVSSKAFKILGFVESTQTVAGTWGTAPSRIQMFSPGVKKPGDIVQTQTQFTTTSGTVTNTAFTALTNSPAVIITAQSPANLYKLTTTGTWSISGGPSTYALQLARGGTLLGGPVVSINQNTGLTQEASVNIITYDIPNTTSPITYSLQGKASVSGISYPAPTSGAYTEVQEIQI